MFSLEGLIICEIGEAVNGIDPRARTDPKGLSSGYESRCQRELEILDVLGIRENL
jgi:hypothetical protein